MDFKTNKGGCKKVIGGFGFNIKLKKNDSTGQQRVYWRCEQQTRTKCRASFITTGVNGEPEKLNNVHNHAAENRTEMLKAVHDADLQHLRGKETLQRLIRREKRKELGSVPNDINEINIPHSLRNYREQPFFRHPLNGPDDFYIFFTANAGNVLQNCAHFSMDATYKTCPRLFYQLLVVGGYVQGVSTVPLVFIMMANKTQDLYTRVMFRLKELLPSWKPEVVTLDFEIAMHNATRELFPAIEVSACHFHFAQNIYRKIQDVGLAPHYKNNIPLQVRLKAIVALSFVPTEDVHAVFVVIKIDLLEHHPELEHMTEDVLNYFERNYLDHFTSAGAVRPKFSPDIWSHYSAMIQCPVNLGCPRTDNTLEANHLALANMMSRVHPDIYWFLSRLQLFVTIKEMDLIALQAGEIPRRKKKYVAVEEKLLRRVRRYPGVKNEAAILQYIRSVSPCLKELPTTD